MKTVELTSAGKPHTITVPDEPKSWAERHHYSYDDLEPWDGERDLFNALPLVCAWVLVVLVAVIVAFWVSR